MEEDNTITEAITETVTEIERLDLPWGREVVLQDVAHGSGLRLLRLRFKEKRRFTIIELDAETAATFGARIARWAEGAQGIALPADSAAPAQGDSVPASGSDSGGKGDG